MEIPIGATHKFRGHWFKEDVGTWTTWVGIWALVDRASWDLLNRQAAPITDYMRALGHLEAVLCAAERCEAYIEGERGKGQSVEQIYAAGEMPDELVAARAFLAGLKGEQP